MGLRMKNFNILGFHWKIQFLGEGGSSQKNNIEGEDSLKKEAWTVCRFKGVGEGGLARKRGWGFWGEVDTPMHTMNHINDKVTIKHVY